MVWEPRNGKEHDVSLGGIPFRLANSVEIPFTTETLPIRKEQFDAEPEPGEQSLSGWWRRSQDSFHQGSGYDYQEARGNVESSATYREGENVDVFAERGRVTLLRTAATAFAPAGTFRNVRSWVDWSTANSEVHFVRETGFDIYTDITATTPAGTYLSPTAVGLVDALRAGDFVYGVDGAGASGWELYRQEVGSPTIDRWPLTGGDGIGLDYRLVWGKHRLWFFYGRAIYQPDLTLAPLANQAAIYVNPVPGWTYTCAAEGPAAMYFGGHDGYNSSIHAIALTDTGGVPTLSGARATAVLPPGELVQRIAITSGQYIGIGTNKGFRVGIIEGEQITYGPLLWDSSPNHCFAVLATGHQFVVSHGQSFLRIVDLTEEIGEGVFPWSEYTPMGVETLTPYYDPNESRIRLIGTESWIGGGAGKIETNTRCSTGYVKTGWIRFRTSEKKLFKYVEVFCEPLPLGASIDIWFVDEDDTLSDFVGQINAEGATTSGPLALPAGRRVKMALQIGLNKGTSTDGPTLLGYTVKAVPSVKPQRVVTLPLLCFDFETSTSGKRYGRKGYAMERVESLQALEDVGDSIQLTQYDYWYQKDVPVIIDNLRFVETAPPPGASGRGGILVVTVRTAEA